ncbi:response regulator transcription factor [Actinophytocola oryzae]|uniref:DNA-binding NarL/FixJ family response regulator n=1 Tax=Actinophytocola oryzae TaxID=502181 RepID=A0A4R7W6N0_9PSEU|nr:response regulator transcription factor [Actinophytocola oryzae]TDV57689.1 DNA-binding NarL/FixJ family response regulator [Actinophytocola oryzae]
MRLIIAEDSLLAREGLIRVLTRLGHEVPAVAVRAEQVLALVARHRPDVAVLDIRLPPTFNDEGLRLGAAIRARHPRVAVLVLSHYIDHTYATALLDTSEVGVGYLLKDNLADDRMLDDVLHRIAAGGTAVDRDVVSALLPASADEPLAHLTQRERDVLTLMAEGLSDQGIADRLQVALTTVGTHTGNVFRKLGIVEKASNNRRVSAVLTYLASRNRISG